MDANDVSNIGRPTDPVHQKKFTVKQAYNKKCFEKRGSMKNVPVE